MKLRNYNKIVEILAQCKEWQWLTTAQRFDSVVYFNDILKGEI